MKDEREDENLTQSRKGKTEKWAMVEQGLLGGGVEKYRRFVLVLERFGWWDPWV
jgi:hypothetical protein